MNNLSIYCYKYPPNQGVGGRRWHLFANRLLDLGYNVRVISKMPDSPLANIKNQTFLRKSKNRLFPWDRNKNDSKLIWHLQKLIAKLSIKGLIWEEVTYLKKEIITSVKQDIDNKVDCIIVSCAPFRWAYYISKYLAEYEGEKPKLIVDIRDPWSSNRLSYFSSSSAKVIHEEAELERYTINKADHVFFVAEKDAENAKRNNTNTNISWVPNGADLTKVLNLKKPHKKSKLLGQIHIVFAGTLYKGGEEFLLTFIKDLNTQLQQNNKPTAHWTIIGIWSPEIISKVKASTDCSFLGVIEPKLIEQEILQADFACSYVSPKLNYAINTKIIEAAALRVPVILLSQKGEVSEFLIRNNLGVHVNLKTMNSKLILEWHNKNRTTGPWQDFREFDINSLVDNKIIKIFDALT